MKATKTSSILLIVALGISILINVVFLVYTLVLKSEYSWLRDTYETDIVGMYQSNGLWMAYKEHLEGRPREYVLDSRPPQMSIAVANFYSHKLSKKGDTSFDRLMRLLFDKSQKAESERIWHTKLKNRWLEAFVKEHNATISRLRAADPNQPLQ